MPNETHSAPDASLRAKPTGFLRRLVRVPTRLYRWHLGWLLGHRFLQLTHRGRKTGLLRRTVLEVIRYDPITRESVVLSGWGATADWYRNIQAHPALEVRTGRRCYQPRQRFLSPQKAAAVVAEFERLHPLEARLAPQILTWLGWRADAVRPTWRELATAIPLVAFRPRE